MTHTITKGKSQRSTKKRKETKLKKTTSATVNCMQYPLVQHFWPFCSELLYKCVITSVHDHEIHKGTD